MLDITIVFKDGVLESVLTNDPKHLADQVHLIICNLDRDTITADEALTYASTVAAEIEELPQVLNEIQEKIETLRQIAKQEP